MPSKFVCKNQTNKHVLHGLHVTHVLQTYSMVSHPGWQDATISAALSANTSTLSLDFAEHP